MISISAVLGILAGLALGWVISSAGIVNPIRRAVDCLRKLARGELSVEIYGTDRDDEIGEIAQTMQVFKETAAEAKRLETEQANAGAERRNEMLALADSFEASVKTAMAVVSNTATELQSAASSMLPPSPRKARARRWPWPKPPTRRRVTSRPSLRRRRTFGLYHRNQQAGATSSETAQKAVNDAERTNASVESLSETADKIGRVVEVINSIASQNDLLCAQCDDRGCARRRGRQGLCGCCVGSQKVWPIKPQRRPRRSPSRSPACRG